MSPAINISFGMFTPAQGAPVPGKHYTLKDGVLIKAQGVFGAADYRTLTASSPGELIKIMQAAPPGSFITQGVAKDVCATRCLPAAALKGEAGAFARNNDHMIEPEGGALVTVDYDPPQYPELAPKDIPSPSQQIKDIAGKVFMVNRPSTSAFIGDATGERGRHINLAVEHGRDRAEQLERLHRHCVLRGWCWPKIDGTGKVSVTTIVDLALKRRVQPQFIAPVLSGGLVRTIPKDGIRITEGGYLNIPALTSTEDAQYEKTIAAMLVLPVVVAQADQNRAQHVEKLKAKGCAAPDIESALSASTLRGDWPLHIRGKGVVAVRDVLASPSKYHGADALDPVAYLEPDYATNYCAKLYLTGQKTGPAIHSMAHGGRNFMLVNDAKADFAEEAATPSALSFLSKYLVTAEGASKMASATFAIPNLIPRGSLSVYVAPGGGGKTAIFTHKAGQLARDGYEVLYINADANPDQLKSQYEKAAKFGFNVLAPDMHIGCSATDVMLDIQRTLDSSVDLSNAVYIIDTLKKFTNLLSKEALKDFLIFMRKLVARGATVCLLAHANKYPDAEGNLVYEGVGDLRSDVDSLIYMYSSRAFDRNGEPATVGGLKDSRVYEVTTHPDKVRAMFQPVSFRIEISSFGVNVFDLDVVLPRFTTELREALAVVINAIESGHDRRDELIGVLKEETMCGDNKARDMLRTLTLMDNSPLLREGGKGKLGVAFTVAQWFLDILKTYDEQSF